MSAGRYFEMLDLVRDIEQYAQSSNEGALDRLYDVVQAGKRINAVAEDVIDAKIIRSCVIRLMKACITDCHVHKAWQCLRFLCCKSNYKGAPRVLQEIPHYPNKLYQKLLSRMERGITNNGHILEIFDIFTVLAELLTRMLPDVHQHAISAHTALRQAIWRYVDGPFLQTEPNVQTPVFQVTSGMLRVIDSEPTDQLWPSIQERAVLITVKAILHVYSEPWSPSKTTNTFLGISLAAALRMVWMLDLNEHTDIDPIVYQLGRNEIFRVTLIVYDLLNTATTVDDAQRTAELAVTCTTYIGSYIGEGSIPAFLLYKPPRVSEAKPMVVLMKEVVRRSGDIALEHVVMRIDNIAPGVAEAVQAMPLPAPPVRTDKDRHCAYPDCGITSQGLVTAMKKCGRCKAVYYCNEIHQRMHWAEHRKVCAKT